MLGMELMLKSLGIDANAIHEQVKQFAQLVHEFNERLTRIEEKIDALSSTPKSGDAPRLTLVEGDR